MQTTDAIALVAHQLASGGAGGVLATIAADDAERAERIANAERRTAAAAARTAAAIAAIVPTDDATAERRRARRNRIANDATAAIPPAASEIEARFIVLARPENAGMIRIIARHWSGNRHSSNTDSRDIEQSLALALATATAGTSAAKAMTLCVLPAEDANRRLAFKVITDMARHYARHDATAAKRERSSGLLTMADFNGSDQHSAYAAALASDGEAEWHTREKMSSKRINGAYMFAAAMGNADATARDDGSHTRMGNVDRMRNTREQVIGGSTYDAKGVIRIVKEKSLENMLKQEMSVKGMLIGGVHGGSGGDAADSLAMRRFQETFYDAPTPRMGGDIAERMAVACDKLRTKNVRMGAALMLALYGHRMPSVDVSAYHAVATGQVRSWGKLVAACVKVTTPRPKRNKVVRDVAASQRVKDVDAADDQNAANPIDATRANSEVKWRLLLSLLGETPTDAAARKVAKAITETLARDCGALYESAKCRSGVVTAERIASPNTRGGMRPVHRTDAMASIRGVPYVYADDAAPQTLRIGRHADYMAKPTPLRDETNAAPRWRGAPPPKVDVNGDLDALGRSAWPVWQSPSIFPTYAAPPSDTAETAPPPPACACATCSPS